MNGEFRTIGSINHARSPATSLPLLMMDMYEHACAIDFGAAAALCIDAFFADG
jgi:Fe-Mn family superoxide dismutase